MFFSISKINDVRFPCHHWSNGICFNLDEGWQSIAIADTRYIFKGYAYYFDLASNIINVTDKDDGSFCIFKIKGQTVELIHSLYRSFPIHYSQGAEVTNLTKLTSTCHADQTLLAFDSALEFTFSRAKQTLQFEITNTQTVVEQIYNKILNKVTAFLQHNTLPIKVFLSGGIDSMLVYSFLQKAGAKVELLNSLHVDLDYFLCQNYSLLKNQYWGYNQIHHYRSPCVLVSGAPGDEFMLRSPIYANIYFQAHGTSVTEMLGHQNCLHKNYFLKTKHLAEYDAQAQNPIIKCVIKNLSATKSYLCNMALNDFQHWHLGNTLTLTPLLDLEIYKLMLQLPYEVAVQQLLDSTISKQLIAMNDSQLLQYLSQQKNSNSFENLWSHIRND